MHYRAYTPADREACLRIFDTNAERFFSPGDRAQFEAFLRQPVEFYGVLCDDDGRVVGCGGIAPSRTDPHAADLTWGMIDAALQGRGFGRLLVQARLRRLADMPGVTRVVLNTSHETAGFYEKMGFRQTAFTPDGYRKGLHRCDMEWVAGAPGH